ncbi:MAG: acyl-CoA dehydrogenase [Candidatus Leucobacter sulfamidivorax]|nr:acyl-CoA dehydrogenase [Candidatus Leucobacter sulfamidivorax]
MSVLIQTAANELGELAAEAIGELLEKTIGTQNISTYAEQGVPLEWDLLAEGGWDLLGVVDEGEGASLRDLVEVAQVWGSRLVPLPYLETVIAKRHSSAAQEWEGPVTIALPSATLAADSGYLPFGTMPGIGVATGLGSGVDEIVAAPSGTAHRLDLAARGIEAPMRTALSSEVAREVAVISAASSVGAARRLLDLGVEFAKEREQFGRPIGSFQAVKHHLADAMIAVEEADTTVIWGSLMPDEAMRGTEFAISRCIDAAEIVLQVHGGLGFTWELGLHFYLRHMLATREVVQGLRAGL